MSECGNLHRANGAMESLLKYLFVLYCFSAAISLIASEGDSVESIQNKTQETQIEDSLESTEKPLDSDRKMLEAVEVVAYNFDSKSLNTPANIVEISRKEIESSAASNLAEVLQKKGGIQLRSVTGNMNSGDLAMRGFGENSQLRVLVIVDGHRLNRADMGSINWMQIPIENIESIEVLSGAHSAEYGNNAVAGVIKIKTLKGVKQNDFTGRLMYGSYGLFTASASYTGKTDDWYYSAEASRFQQDGYRQNSDSWSDSFNLSLGNFLSDSTTIDLGLNYNMDYIHFPGPLSTWEQAEDDPRQSLQNNQFGRTNSAMANARLNSNSLKGELDAVMGFNYREGKWTWDSKWYDNNQWNFTFNPRYDYEIDDNLSTFAGIDFSYDNIDYHSYLDNKRNNAIEKADIDMQMLGVYVGGKYEPVKKLLLTGAARFELARIGGNDVRYDPLSVPEYIWRRGQWIKNPLYSNPPKILSQYDDSKWYPGFAADAGVTYKLDDKSSVFVRFDQLFRYPATDEVASYQGYNMPKPFNTSLKPEKGQNYEIGYKYAKKGFSATATSFVQMLEDEISYDAVESLNINLDPTLRYGFEARTAYDETYYGASLSMTILKAQFNEGKYDGNDVPLVPQYTGIATVYVKPLDWIKFSASLNYVGNQTQGNDYYNVYRKIPDYVTVDFSANFAFSRYTEIFFAIENAFDKNYVSASWLGALYPGMGRVMKMGIIVKF